MQAANLGVARWCFRTATLLGILVLAVAARAQTVLDTQQQANDKIQSLAASTRTPAHDYVIGNGDLISVQVFDVPELSRDVRVSQTGAIGIPLVPVRLHISGLTELQAEQKIAEVLEANGLVSHPQVAVSVKERRSNPITIVGAVAHPMVYEADHAITLLEALAAAGGIANDAGDDVIVTRPQSDPNAGAAEPAMISAEDATPLATQQPAQLTDAASAPKSTPPADAGAADSAKTVFPSAPPAPATSANPTDRNASPQNEPPPLNNTITVNLNALLESGDATNNILLQAGDIVNVPHAGIIYALGSVGRPGGFVVANDRQQMTTLKLLSLAGGFSRTAKLENSFIIRRDSEGRQSQVPVDLKKILNFQTEDVQLRPSDILYVPNNTTKQVLYQAVAIGIGILTAAAIYRVAYH